MFYHQKYHHNHTHGFLLVLSLLAAFLLGRKSEQYGYSIVSRGYCCENDDEDMMSDPNSSYPQ